MRRLGLLGALALSMVTSLGLASAQDGFAGMSDTLLREQGLPVADVQTGPDGATAPTELAAGLTLVTLSAEDPLVGYLDIVQYPAELDEATAIEQALAAGNGDLPQDGWTYFGGTNTPDAGLSASFVIDLEPGDYFWAVSAYSVDQQGADEVMELLPFTVAEGDGATPAITELPATVTLTATDALQYTVSPDPVPAGPQIWHYENTGATYPHHVVMMSVPAGTTSGDIIEEMNAMFTAMMAGTPPAVTPDSIMMQMAPAGYAALQSGGQSTWFELDLTPGTYAVVCYIVDPANGRLHVMDGMTTVFTVE